MTIKKFFVFSILLHIIIFAGIYFIPVGEEKQPKELFARLVPPEEIVIPAIETPPSKIIPAPLPPHAHQKIPFSRRVPDRPAPQLSPEKPVAPDFGRETGKPLPEGTSPKPGKEEYGHGKADEEKKLKPGYSDKEKIFNNDVITDLVKKESVKEGNWDSSITFETNEYRYVGYMKKLRDKIESIWVYPPEAAAKGIYGDLIIHFVIKKNGKLGSVDLVRTSGYQMLDDAAMKALKDCEPYWPLPDEWGMDSYSITGHFIYNPYGYYIR